MIQVFIKVLKYWVFPDIILTILQVLYTGDFSRQEDRHLMAAELPTVKPDVLIIVS